MRPLRHDADPQQSTASPTRTARSKAPTAISRRRVKDALLLRGSHDFADLAAYRQFIDEIVGRHNARNRPAYRQPNARYLKTLPNRRTSRLRGCQRPRHLVLRLHIAQGLLHRPVAADRPPAAGAPLRRPPRTVPRRHAADDPAARARPPHRHARPGRQLSSCHPSLRKKPMALMNLVYRDQLFPRQAFRRTFDALLERLRRPASLPHHRRSTGARPRAGLRGRIGRGARRDAAMPRRLPDMAVLRARFTPRSKILRRRSSSPCAPLSTL